METGRTIVKKLNKDFILGNPFFWCIWIGYLIGKKLRKQWD